MAARVQVVGLGLACCAVEYHAAWQQESLQAAADAAVAELNVNVLVLAGTITRALAPVVVAEYEALGPHPAVIAFGACTISGGPYWDSYSVVPGSVIPVDVHVPGCPPSPQALALGFAQLCDAVRGRTAT